MVMRTYKYGVNTGCFVFEVTGGGMDDTRPIIEFDTMCRDKSYWAGIFSQIRDLPNQTQKQAEIVVAAVKDLRYRERTRRKNWEEMLAREVVEWVRSVFVEQARDECCVDNYRVADTRKSSQMRRYKSQKANGCCGFFDQAFECPIDGKTYLIGFNYGH